MNYYPYRSSFRDKVFPILIIALFVLAGVCFIGWIIAEFCSTRTFVGTLVDKDAPISFSYDVERVYHDDKGNLKTRGDDETIAHKKYLLTFRSSEGVIKVITAGSSRGYVPYVRREDLALQVLYRNDVEPPLYTHAKKDVEYVVTVSGWLLDGTLKDITPLSIVKVE